MDNNTVSCMTIGVAKILSGVHFFAKKVDDLFQSSPSKYTSKSKPLSKNCPKNWRLLCLGVHFVTCGGALTHFFPVN